MFIRFAHESIECCLRLRLRPPVARSANRGRVLASLEIWRPSPIFALRLTCKLEYETSHPHDTTIPERRIASRLGAPPACPSLDRRIGAAFSLRSKYGGRRRSSHLGYIEIYKTRFRSAQSSGTCLG